MIYTVTINPSIDYVVSVSDFQTGRTNRTEKEYILPGGKGINVSMVLKNLGVESIALGFVAGFTGEEIVRRVSAKGINSRFIRLEEGMTRINVKIPYIDGTEINGSGPCILEKHIQKLMEQMEELQSGDVLFLSGSVPASVSKDIYARITECVSDRGVSVVADAAGELLLKTIEYHPFLIKPNLQELEELFGKNVFDAVKENAEALRMAVIPYGEKLRQMGARNVLMSLGGAGAVLVAEDGRVYHAPAPEGEVINTVGSGDSMVAGFMTGWMEEGDYGHAFYRGLAAGSASAFSADLATKEAVWELYQQIVR